MTDMAEIAPPQRLTSTDVAVHPLTRTQLRFAAELHAAALPHGFFSRLGPRFMRSYYDGFRASPHAMALVATVNERAVGMLVGTTANRTHYRWLLRSSGLRLAVVGLLALLARPAELRFFLRTRVLRYLRGLRRLRQRSAPTQTPAGRVAVLTHVAVSPQARGAGAGAALVAEFVRRARAAGCSQACLVTLRGDDGAGAFYRHLGWIHVEDRCDADGREISVFERLL